MSRGERLYGALLTWARPGLPEEDRALLIALFRRMRAQAVRRPRVVWEGLFWLRMVADLVLLRVREPAETTTGRGGGGAMQDLIQAVRVLRRSPGATALAVLTLALGIGGTTAMFSVVNGVVLSPLPYPDPDRMIAVWERTDEGQDISTSFLNFEDWREGASTVEAMAAFVPSQPITVLTGNGGVRARVSRVSADFFQVVGTAPIEGRTFDGRENRPGGPAVAVVAESFWRTVLGAPDDLASVTVNIEGDPYHVVGVMPADVDLPTGADIWAPLERFVPWDVRNNHVVRVVGRLGSGASPEAASEEVDAIHQRIHAAFPEVSSPGARARSLQEELVGESTRALVLLLVAAGLLTLVACTNVASTLLARGLGRRRELAIRASLGADRPRLLRQLLLESGLLGVMGGVAGIGVAQALVTLAKVTESGSVPRLDEVGLDGRVLGFAVLAGLASSLVFGLLPSLRLTFGRLAGGLRTRPTGGSDRDVRRSWRVLAGAEVALATLLLVGAGLTGRSLDRILSRDNGIRTDGVVTASIHFPQAEYSSAAQGVAFIDELVGELEADDAVSAAGTILLLPIAGSGQIAGPLELPDGQRTDETYGYQVAHPGYFEVLGIDLVAGRSFEPTDGPDAPHVVIVDEVLAARLWPGEDPLGKRFNPRGMDPYRDQELTVIGVVREVRNWRQEAGDNPSYYVSFRQRPAFYSIFGMQVVVAGERTGLVVDRIRALVQEIDPDVPVQIQTLESLVSDSASTQRFAGTVLGAFSLLALLLAGLGLYSVIGYTVAQRRNEMGVRIALGADTAGLFRQVLREALVTAGLGVGIGLVVAGALGRLMEPLLFSVSAVDPATYVVVTTVLICAALFAAWWPARRTLSVEPAATLRGE